MKVEKEDKIFDEFEYKKLLADTKGNKALSICKLFMFGNEYPDELVGLMENEL